MKNWDINQPQPGMDIWSPKNLPRRILTQVNIETYILEANRGSTLMGIAPTTDTKWSSRTRRQHAASQAMAITSQLRD